MSGHKIIIPSIKPLFAPSEIKIFHVYKGQEIEAIVKTVSDEVDLKLNISNYLKNQLNNQDITDIENIYQHLKNKHKHKFNLFPSEIHFKNKVEDPFIKTKMIAALIYICYESTQKVDDINFWIDEITDLNLSAAEQMIISALILGGIQHISIGNTVLHKRWPIPQDWKFIEVPYDAPVQYKTNDLSMLGMAYMSFDLKLAKELLTSMRNPSPISDLIEGDSFLINHIYGGVSDGKNLTFISINQNAFEKFTQLLKEHKYTFQYVETSIGIHRM